MGKTAYVQVYENAPVSPFGHAVDITRQLSDNVIALRFKSKFTVTVPVTAVAINLFLTNPLAFLQAQMRLYIKPHKDNCPILDANNYTEVLAAALLAAEKYPNFAWVDWTRATFPTPGVAAVIDMWMDFSIQVGIEKDQEKYDIIWQTAADDAAVANCTYSNVRFTIEELRGLVSDKSWYAFQHNMQSQQPEEVSHPNGVVTKDLVLFLYDSTARTNPRAPQNLSANYPLQSMIQQMGYGPNVRCTTYDADFDIGALQNYHQTTFLDVDGTAPTENFAGLAELYGRYGLFPIDNMGAKSLYFQWTAGPRALPANTVVTGMIHKLSPIGKVANVAEPQEVALNTEAFETAPVTLIDEGANEAEQTIRASMSIAAEGATSNVVDGSTSATPAPDSDLDPVDEETDVLQVEISDIAQKLQLDTSITSGQAEAMRQRYVRIAGELRKRGVKIPGSP